jgi:RNA 3'-terminal phosphate cyclase
MLKINHADIDWLMIRQALSLALLKSKSVNLVGGQTFLNKNPQYKQLFNDMSLATANIGAGELFCDRESIIYRPQRVVPGVFGIASSSLSSAVEILLFLMPGLFYGDFRTIINFEGVTHSVLSYPTAFIKEMLLNTLERLGFYSSLTLKRFGFYGSGGGMFESRIYPQEAKPSRIFAGTSRTLSGARIYFSHMASDLALREKHILTESLGLDHDKIAIIEVMDSDGPGNSIQIYANVDGLDMVFFREAPFFSEKGDIIFDEDLLPPLLKGLTDEVNAAMREGNLPGRLMRELYPYMTLCGSEIRHEGKVRIEDATRGLVEKFLR